MYHIRAWGGNPRVWAAFLLGMGICLYNSARYLSFINGIDSSAQILESYIVIGNRAPFLLGVLLGGLLLLSDAPFVTPLSPYEVLRTGRKCWFWTRVIYIVFASVLYVLLMLAFTCLVTAVYSKIFWRNAWSEGMYMLAVRQPEFVIRKYVFAFPFPELLQKTSPCRAAFDTLIFNSLYLSVMGCCILAVNLRSRRNLGWVVAAVLHIFGYMAYTNGGLLIPLRYSLFCCAIPAYHYEEGLRMSAVYSFAALCFFGLAFAVAGRRQISKTETFGE